MRLREFLSSAVTCRPEASLAEAAAEMERHNIGSVLVADDAGHAVGIVTDRDIVIRGISKERGPNTPVTEVMTRDVTSLPEDADPFDAAARMASAECRRLPVLGADGTLKGIVSLDDLMVLFTRQADNLAHVIAAEMAAH